MESVRKAIASFACLVFLAAVSVPPSLAQNSSPSNRAAQNDPWLEGAPLAQIPQTKLLPPMPAEAQQAGRPGDDITSGTAQDVTPGYILGPGDQMNIVDYSSSDNGEPIPTLSVPIMPDGTMVVHPIGVVHAAGLTVGELNALVTARAQKFFIKPDIELSVANVRPTTVYILGEVSKPGLYSNQYSNSSASGGLGQAPETVAPVTNLTVTSALQKAGGLKESANVRQIRITRLSTRAQVTVDLWKLLVEGDTTQDIAIEPGDVIFVPKGGGDYNQDAIGLAGNQVRRVRIWGAVRSPGLIEMAPEDDVLSAISKAGGFIPTAKRNMVLLSRVSRDGSITAKKISIKSGIKDPDSEAREHLHPGDLIIVSDSLLKRGAGDLYKASLGLMVGIALTYYQFKLYQGQNNINTSSPAVIPIVPAP